MGLNVSLPAALCRIALISLAVSGSGCSTQTIKLSRWVPSEVPLGSMTYLAVAPLDGDDGDDGAHLLQEALQEVGPFELLPGVAHPANALPPSAGDIDAAIRWGRALGADGVIGGSLSVHNITVAYRAPLSEAVDGPTTCTLTQEARVEITGYIALCDADTGRTILYEPVAHTYTASEPVCAEALDDAEAVGANVSSGIRAVPVTLDQDALRLAALMDFAHTLAHRLVPHDEGEEVMLFTDRALPQSQAAIEALVVGDWQSAVAIYRSAVRKSDTWTTPKWAKARAHYTLGTTLAFGGVVDEGIAELRTAQQLAPSPLFAKQLARAEAYRSGKRVAAARHRLWHCRRGANNEPVCARARGP
jgi:hypothetical protein